MMINAMEGHVWSMAGSGVRYDVTRVRERERGVMLVLVYFRHVLFRLRFV